MIKSKYQPNYAANRPQMYEIKSREEKALRIIKLLQVHLGKNNLKKLTVLDVGASTGIIDNYLSRYFKKVVGTDIDKKAIRFAQKNYHQKNLRFKIEDAMKLTFSDSFFDLVICTHVYEHVPNSQKLFQEIYRVLKPNGICYLAAINSLWPIEPHYDLPFLSWLPKNLADSYVKLFQKADEYYEHPQSYWGIKKLTHQFLKIDYTAQILREPQKFGFDNKIKGIISPIASLLSPLATYFAPTFFWLLIKNDK